MWYNADMKSAKKAVKKAAAARRKAAVKKTARVGREAAARNSDALSVNIRNLGPVARADLRLKPLTVLAGPNGTGKTFVCKAIHSAVSVMIANPAEELFRRNAQHIRFRANALKQEMPMSVRHARRFATEANENTSGTENAEIRAANFFAELEDRLDSIGLHASSVFFEGGLGAQTVADLREECKALLAFYRKSRATLVSVAQNTPAREISPSWRSVGKARPRDMRVQAGRDSPDITITEDQMREIRREWRNRSIHTGAKSLWQAIAAMTKVQWDDKALTFRESGGTAFYNGIAANFQIAPQDVLGRMKNAAARVSIGPVDFALTPESGSIEISRRDVRVMRKWSRALFLDSPVYWKLKGALESMRFSSGRRRELDGIPQYFYDLAALLRKRLVSSSFPGVCQRLEEIIGGRIILTDTGKLRFQGKDREGHGEYSMHATAAGIVNLGILSMLIERGVVDGNALVVVDEPESNLHPRWQEVMAETLARLAAAGAHIVVATHSDWMLSTIANIVRRGELGEDNGEEAALTKEQVGVWLFDHGRKGGGVTTRELTFDSITGYIPKNLRDLSNTLHNETADLLDAMDEREMSNAVKEGAE